MGQSLVISTSSCKIIALNFISWSPLKYSLPSSENNNIDHWSGFFHDYHMLHCKMNSQTSVSDSWTVDHGSSWSNTWFIYSWCKSVILHFGLNQVEPLSYTYLSIAFLEKGQNQDWRIIQMLHKVTMQIMRRSKWNYRPFM